MAEAGAGGLGPTTRMIEKLQAENVIARRRMREAQAENTALAERVRELEGRMRNWMLDVEGCGGDAYLARLKGDTNGREIDPDKALDRINGVALRVVNEMRAALGRDNGEER